MLRVNLSVPVTLPSDFSRLGVLGGDLQGWPNGRRLGDDVVDIAEQAVAGALISKKVPLGDGVDGPDQPAAGRLPVRGGSRLGLREREGQFAVPRGRPSWGAGSPRSVVALMRTTQNEWGQGGEAAVTTAVERRKIVIALGLAFGALFLALFARGMGPQAAQAASHREAPLIALDPTADITDFFMFRDYEPGQQDKVALIMDVIPGEEPSSGPNYWNFDPNVLYKFSVDNNGDGNADDVELEFRFRTEPIRGIARQFTLPFSYVGGAGGLPPITALDGPGSEGLGLRQRYTVTLVRGHHRTQVADGLIAVPSNVGPRTMPNYAALAAQGTYDLGNGIKVFAGQREDPFYIDLGGVFDTLNLRRVPPIETPAEDANDNVNPFGTDMLSGFNVHSIAIELPASMLTGDTGATTIGGYASTSRPHVEVDGDGHRRVQAGPATCEPARQRGDHRHGRQGPLELARARPGEQVRGLLPQPAPGVGAGARVRRSRGEDEPHGSP